VTPGSCATCHNGTQARGKTATHVPTTQACDTCHRTTGWIPATFSHIGVTPGSCATCHNGTTARGKTATHVPTTQACDTCHRTTAWIPATFSHTGVTPGTCASCHNGTTATGKSTGHFVTTQSCDVCHRAGVAWTPVTAYTHRSAFYKAHNSSVTCNDCHKTNNEVIAWQFAGYKPDCAGCHAGVYKEGPHKKVDSTVRIYYNVVELKDCSGSCHVYTDITFTTILKSRSSKHRSTDGGF
jgi:succinate dehydrogenase/fumarate reductase cytochrome b subunit